MAIQVAHCAPVVAAAQEGRVQIWNWDTAELLSEFPTVFDNCNRLALSPTGNTVIAANWRKGRKAGVACYETTSGREIWHRTDLRQLQHMTFSFQDDWVWCNVEDRPIHVLDAKSGLTLETLRGVRDVVDSPYSSHRLALLQEFFAVGTPEKSVSIPRLARSGLKAAFSPTTVCICEYWNPTIRPVPTIEGAVRCLDCESGTELWRYRPPDDYFIQIISHQKDGYFYAVQSGCVNNNWIVSLIRLSPQDGACSEIRSLGALLPDFGGFGEGILVMPNGETIGLTTGEVLRQLAFT